MTTSLNRRSLVKGAAWAAPAVAATTAIPAYAASRISPDTCQRFETFSWARYTRDQGLQLSNGQNNLTGRATHGSQSVFVSHVSHTDSHFQGVDMLTPFNKTMGWGDVVSPFAQSTDFLNFQTSTNNRRVGRNSTITLTFDPPVYNLNLPILDVDKGSTVSGGAWEDHLTVSGAAFTATTGASNYQSGNTIIANADALDNTTNGNVTLHFAGPVSTINLHWSNGSQNGSQRIGIGAFSYCNENLYNSSVG